METEKLNKKGMSVLSVFVSILLVVAVVSGMYLYYANNMNQAGQVVDSKYTGLYNNMSTRQQDLNDQTQTLRETINKIQESESIFVQGYYGLKGFGQSILLLPKVITTGIGTSNDVVTGLNSFVPSWAILLFVLAITIIIIFAILKAIRGGLSDI